jgi:hypothetical protein
MARTLLRKINQPVWLSMTVDTMVNIKLHNSPNAFSNFLKEASKNQAKSITHYACTIIPEHSSHRLLEKIKRTAY